MSDAMKTLLLNPPSFDAFDGGAGSRWPAVREIESYWYPVWLSYPAGMLPGSRLLDAPPHKISKSETVQIANDYEFVVLFTSAIGYQSDLELIRRMKVQKPDLKIAFVGPHVHSNPEGILKSSSDIDFVVRGEIDYAVVEYAQGFPMDQILGISYWKNGKIVHNGPRPQLHGEELDALPFAVDTYKRDLDIERYNVPFLLHPFVAFYTSRGCPALCTFCQWPQTISGHAWRVRSTDNVVQEVKRGLSHFPQMKEFFFDDDTFNIRKDRVIELCKKFKPLKLRWSSTARVHSDYETVKAMADGGARLFIVGFESGDAQILKNIKKGATPEMGREFMKHCRKVGIKVHGDFIIGLPGETESSIQKTIEYAKELDCETIQVSIAHAFPGTELYDYLTDKSFLTVESLGDSAGHQQPHISYPDLSRQQMMEGVNRFYDSYYFRPKVVWRIVREALWDSHERKRLYHEAVEYLHVRSERAKWAQNAGGPKKSLAST